MKGIWENRWFCIPVALFFGGGLAILKLIPYGDEILYFNSFRHEPLNTIFEFFTYCGEVWSYLIFGIAALFLRPRFTLLIAITGILTMPLMYALKDTIGMDRPITFFDKKAIHNELVLVPSEELNRGQTSFPSGHTMSAFALYSLLALMAGREREHWGLPLALLAILVGISRIFLVQHFLADVIAGAILGLLLCAVVWRVDKELGIRMER